MPDQLVASLIASLSFLVSLLLLAVVWRSRRVPYERATVLAIVVGAIFAAAAASCRALSLLDQDIEPLRDLSVVLRAVAVSIWLGVIMAITDRPRWLLRLFGH